MKPNALYKKYIPLTFDNIIGQDLPIKILNNIINNISKVKPHGIIFSGPSGVGKTSLAKLFVKNIMPDEETQLIEVDGAQDNGVTFIKQLIEQMKYIPLNSTYKIALIDEVHMLSRSAFDALLLYLENPDPHSIFIFSTTKLEKIPLTIQSRMLLIRLSKIAPSLLNKKLKIICEQEKIQCNHESLDMLIHYSQGNLRTAYSTLQTLRGLTPKEWKNYFKILSQNELLDLFELILSGKLVQALEQQELFEQSGYTNQLFYKEFSKLLNNISTGLFVDNEYTYLYEKYHISNELLIGFWEIILTQQEGDLNGIPKTIPMMIKMMSTVHDSCSIFGYAKKMLMAKDI